MGNTSSKQTAVVSDRRESTEQDFNEKQAYSYDATEVSEILNKLDLESADTNGDIFTCENLNAWETDFSSNSKNVLAQNAVAQNDIYSVIANNSSAVGVKHQYLFNNVVKTIGSPGFYDNQKLSGRCWMFATCNILRTHVIKNYNLKEDEFQVAQAYLFFYDKLERANFALDNLIDTAEEDLDSRIVSYILSDPVGDGGQWDMIVNLVEKYGIVPHEFFPDNAQAASSSTLNYILKEKIREYALVLRKLKVDGALDAVIKSVKDAMMKKIYNIISISLGTPPKPTDTFTWEYIDKNGKFGSITTTPLEFYKTQVNYPAPKFFSLIHDPRNTSGKLYTVDRLNNMSNGRKIQYVNTSLDSMKETAIKMIKADEPVFFGCDVGKYYNRTTGVLDLDQYDFGLGFGTALNSTKKDRLQTWSSAMTHAMVLVGVHLDADGKPVRWKIENSWGGDAGDKGYFVMTDAWFDEFVLQIVSSKTYASKEDYAVWKGQDYTVLPFYDPMGALA